MSTHPTPPTETHPDPLTGEPGAHVVGTTLGAVALGAATTALGTVLGGPVGALVGAAIGPMLGGLAGKEIAEVIDPTVETPAAASESHPLLEKIEPVVIHHDTDSMSAPPLRSSSVPAAAIADAHADPVDKRAAEIARRQGRPHVADSDRRRALAELTDESVSGVRL